jgi:hypothetical protein
MQKVLFGGMLLTLLTSVCVAQRGHAAGGVAPMARTTPNAITTSHGGIAPNARTAGSVTTVTPKTTTVAPHARTKVAPKATVAPNANTTVAPNARTSTPVTVAPDARTTAPDAQQ